MTAVAAVVVGQKESHTMERNNLSINDSCGCCGGWQKESHTMERNNLSINDSCGYCGGWAEGNPHCGKKQFINK